MTRVGFTLENVVRIARKRNISSKCFYCRFLNAILTDGDYVERIFRTCTCTSESNLQLTGILVIQHLYKARGRG